MKVFKLLMQKQFHLLQWFPSSSPHSAGLEIPALSPALRHLHQCCEPRSDIHVTWKLLAITVCIITAYAAIAQYEAHPFFGFFYFAIFFQATLVYALLYQKAFKAPVLFEETKALLMLNASKCEDRNGRKVLQRSVMSIVAVGMKVREFHTLERTSTPAFMDCVLSNVAGLLVAHS